MSTNIKPYFTYGVSSNDRDLITSTTTYCGQHKRYFSSLDAEIYIGNERILDIFQIDFTYEEKKYPYYGFNSFWPSAIFTGQKIIEGTFIINFTETGYISKLLQKIEASKLGKDFEMIGKPCNIENSPLFNKSFDILIGYGGYDTKKEESFNNTYQELQGVHVNRYQQVLDTSGQPIMEIYGFIAKNIKFGGYEYNDSNSINSDSNNSSDSISSTDLIGYEIVEKRDEFAVEELRNKCAENTKYLGIIVNLKHSLHKDKNDNTSHIYLEIEQINNNAYNSVKDNEIILTLTDIDKENISESYALELENGAYNIWLNTEKTKPIKNKLSEGDQKLIQALIEVDVSYNGNKQCAKKNVWMIRGDNYSK